MLGSLIILWTNASTLCPMNHSTGWTAHEVEGDLRAGLTYDARDRDASASPIHANAA
jgi:hypothetical protein